MLLCGYAYRVLGQDMSMDRVEYYGFRPHMDTKEIGAWIRWFHQHGVQLGDPGDGRVLVWRYGQSGYAMRDVARRRIGWLHKNGYDEYLQLESPPLPFPIHVCQNCDNTGHACEEHPGSPWGGLAVIATACDCGAPGIPCPTCCDPVPGTRRIEDAFCPRHLRADDWLRANFIEPDDPMNTGCWDRI